MHAEQSAICLAARVTRRKGLAAVTVNLIRRLAATRRQFGERAEQRSGSYLCLPGRAPQLPLRDYLPDAFGQKIWRSKTPLDGRKQDALYVNGDTLTQAAITAAGPFSYMPYSHHRAACAECKDGREPPAAMKTPPLTLRSPP